jgi:hypothetical protein
MAKEGSRLQIRLGLPGRSPGLPSDNFACASGIQGFITSPNEDGGGWEFLDRNL